MFPTTLILVDPTCLVSARPGKAVAVQSVGLLKSGSLGHFPELLASVLSICVFPGLLKDFCTRAGLLIYPLTMLSVFVGGGERRIFTFRW